MSSFYTEDELKAIGFASVGRNVLISRKASIYYPQKINIGNNVRIDDFCILSGKITIGNYIHIAAQTLMFAGKAGIEMHDFSGTSSKVAIYAESDDYSGSYMSNPTVPDKFRSIISKKVTLERHVLVGVACVILPGVTLGEGSSFGAMSLINKSSESWSIYVGTPAKKIKERSKELLKLEDKLLSETMHDENI